MDMLLNKIEMAQATVGVERAVPMLVGPITIARLAKLTNISVPDFTAKLVPVYQQLLAKLASMKVTSFDCVCRGLVVLGTPDASVQQCELRHVTLQVVSNFTPYLFT